MEVGVITGHVEASTRVKDPRATWSGWSLLSRTSVACRGISYVSLLKLTEKSEELLVIGWRDGGSRGGKKRCYGTCHEEAVGEDLSASSGTVVHDDLGYHNNDRSGEVEIGKCGKKLRKKVGEKRQLESGKRGR